MQLDRLTRRLQEALADALERARRAGNPEIVSEHLALALLEQEGGQPFEGMRENADFSDEEEDEPRVAPIPLGHIVRYERDRVHPESLPLEAVDVLRKIIDGDTSEVVDRALADLLTAESERHGRPIQYAYVPQPLAIWDTWTPFAGVPAAFEAPSAGFKLVAKSEINANPKDTKANIDRVFDMFPRMSLGGSSGSSPPQEAPRSAMQVSNTAIVFRIPHAPGALVDALDVFKQSKIIALTASVMASEVKQLQDAGFDGLIGKPVMRHVRFPGGDVRTSARVTS